MAIAIQSKEKIFSDDIIIGHAKVVATHIKGKLHWALPGGRFTSSQVNATTHCRRMNQIIKANMHRLNCDLLFHKAA